MTPWAGGVFCTIMVPGERHPHYPLDTVVPQRFDSVRDRDSGRGRGEPAAAHDSHSQDPNPDYS